MGKPDGVLGKAMKMIKGLFALIYEDMLNECNTNNSLSNNGERHNSVYTYLLGVNIEKGDR